MRKIAANYIFLPGFSLVKNGYVVWEENGRKNVVDTGGEIREIAGLEFYGGFIVPDFVSEYIPDFHEGENLVPELEKCYSVRYREDYKLAIIEGANLRSLTWKEGAVIRMIR